MVIILCTDACANVVLSFNKKINAKRCFNKKKEGRGMLLSRTVSRCQSRLNLMKCLRGTNWGSDPETLMLLYKQTVRPILEYGSIAFANACKTNLLRLQRVQNHAIRIAFRSPIYTPSRWLHHWANIPYLRKRYITLGVNYLHKASDANRNKLLAEFLKDFCPRDLTDNPLTPLEYFYLFLE